MKLSIEYQKMGFNFTIGAGAALALCIAIIWVIGGLFQPINDCDKSKVDRCGMVVAVDNKTGKEYLLSPHGGIIERATK